MEFNELEKLCDGAVIGIDGRRILELVLPSPFGAREDRRQLWPAGPFGWVQGLVVGMNLLVEFDADEVLAYLHQCGCNPRLDGVRAATVEDFAVLVRT